MRIKPGYAEAYNNLGNVYDDQGLSTLALQQYEQALRHNPTYANAYYNRGVALFRLGRLNQALIDFQAACGNGSDSGCTAFEEYSRKL